VFTTRHCTNLRLPYLTSSNPHLSSAACGLPVKVMHSDPVGLHSVTAENCMGDSCCQQENLFKIAAEKITQSGTNHCRSYHCVDRFCIPPAKDEFFSHAQRSAIVDYILRRKRYSDDPSTDHSIGKDFVTFKIKLVEKFILHS